MIGAPRDLSDTSIFHRLSLIPFLAWVGLGADGLSSSAYGPEEAFRTLGEHAYLAVGLAALTATTVFLISAAYSRIIEHFPHGGGGYVVATKLLGERVGVVSGSALLVDYVLTITVSIAAAGDALFSFLPAAWQAWKPAFEIVATRVATPANEDYLLSFARAGTAWHVEQLVRKYRGAERRRETAEAKRQHAERSLSYWYDEDGSLVIHGRLPAELGGMVVKAIEAAQEALFRNESADGGDGGTGDSHSLPVDERSAVREPGATPPAVEVRPLWIPEDHEGPPARRADALAFLAESFLANGGAALTAGERYLLHVHVDEAALPADGEGTRCHLEDGAAIAAETARRVGCDCSRVCIHEGGGEVLSVGRKTRQIPPAIRRALRSRDGGCQFPGCVHRRFVDGHHIEHWADGGETRLENLVTLCRRHHRLVHEGGYGVAAAESGPVFTDPRGRVLRCRVAPAVTAGAAGLAAGHRRAGLAISHRTIRPEGWYGERVDRGWAVEGLQLATDPEARL